MPRCTITVLRSSRRGGAAVADLDGLRSGYTVTIRRESGVTISELAYSGTQRLGTVGDWLAETARILITAGRGTTAYDLEICDGEVIARSVASVDVREVA